MAAQDDDAAKRIHGEFMQMALQLVDGRLDSSQYEDSCRQLLGMLLSPLTACQVFGHVQAQLLMFCAHVEVCTGRLSLVVRTHNEGHNIQQIASAPKV